MMMIHKNRAGVVRELWLMACSDALLIQSIDFKPTNYQTFTFLSFKGHKSLGPLIALMF